jgi:hypothetical protein
MASFRKAWPEVMQELDDESHGGRGRGLQLLEEYDPEDETSENAVSRPWAFVCDCVRVLPTGKVQQHQQEGNHGGGDAAQNAIKGPALSMNITELIAEGPGSTPKAWEALADLRDKIADGEKIDWWVIYNGDPERAYDTSEDEEEDEDVTDEQGEEVYEDQQPNRKTFVPQDEAIRRNSAPSPARQAQAEAQVAQVPKSSPKPRGMPPPPIPLAQDRDKGKRTPGMRAFPSPQKQMPPPPAPAPAPAPAVKPVVKTETGLKKFFGKK